MNCDAARERLNDYVDGLMSPDESTGIANHIRSCAACHADEKALRAVLRQAHSLPKNVEPNHDLWDGIAAQLQARPPDQRAASRVTRSKVRRTVLIAAGGLAALVAGIVMVSPFVVDQQPNVLGHPAPSADITFTQTRDKLLAQLDAQVNGLPPDTRRVVKENLQIIDNALAQIRTSLAKNPGNTQLASLLTATEKQEVRVIHQAMNAASGY